MDKPITELLHEIQQATAWSQPKIAIEVGVSQPTINRILKGQVECKGSTLTAIRNLHVKTLTKKKRSKAK
jgi:predicted transcriptional regulator